MGKPGLGLFTGRRKSQSNVLDDIAGNGAPASPDVAAPAPPAGESGGFRLMSRPEVDRIQERRKTMEKEKKSTFPRFSGFGSASSKARQQSFEDDSPGSSKRDSKSSSGTQFSTSRPYINGQHGSTSTLPSSTDTGSDDNLFANVPRPQIAQHSSSPNSYFSSKKTLPALPKTSSGAPSNNSNNMPFGFGKRDRAMTTSSYASTAMPPKLDQDLSFGDESSFDDIFSGLNRKPSPEMSRQPEPTGRSLLAEKRTFQPEPIKVLPQKHVEAPLRSWDSRGSADNLMDSPRSDNDDSPPPVPPPHKYQQYAPVSMAPDSPDLQSSATFRDRNGQAAREPFMRGGSTSPEQNNASISTSSANSFETPLSSRSASTNATPRAPLPPSAIAYNDDDDDNMFAPPPQKPQAQTSPAPRAAPPVAKNPPRPVANGGSRVMSQAEFREYQKKRAAAPPPEDSESDEDYEDEEEAIKKREEEEVLRRKNQQMSFAREAMRRSTTAPADPNRPESIIDNAFGNSTGFPSETSMKADEWEDEDVPLGILQQHGFPSAARNRVPSQPANAVPSYFPDRPASAGAMGGNRASNLPAFARGLPMDPHSSFIGGGLVHHANRESLGFNNFPRGPQSVAGDAMGGGYGQGPMGVPPPLMYQDAGMAAPSLVDQIQMRDMTKKKYLGGASSKQKPAEGPFTGMLGAQMNSQGQVQNPTRMSQMPPMNGMNGMGMNGMNGMNPMMGGGMSPGQMPMMGMGMGQMGYMPQQQDFMQMQQQYQQMQQMMAMQFQQMQMQQMQQQQQQQQDPRMSMAMPNNVFNNGMMGQQMGQGQNMMGNNSFLNVPGMQNGMQPPHNRPMSIISQQQRPFSTFGGGMGMGPGPGYTPSIAPSERSNIGLSARYRPVTNHSDAVSNGTSMTLQATSGGANKPGVIKGILKKSPQINVEEKDDEEDWGSMAARKSKFGKGKENQSSGLEDLTRGLNI